MESSDTQMYLVPTPIGNLKDITFRAIEVLNEVDLILAEDTRTSKKLLDHYEINTPLRSYHAHNEHKVLDHIIKELKEGKVMALVSDAGTPAISDPGFLLSRACLENDIKLECLPGATAFVPALVKSGMPSDKFIYEGFLPHKKGRQTRINEISDREITTVLYESPHRIKKLINQLDEVLDENRKISVTREISKKFEETITGTTKELLEHFNNKDPKGEFVVVIEGK